MVQGRTRNVSRGGLCADLADPLTVGADIEVDIQLVFEGDVQSEPLRVQARVAWCTPVDEAHQVGLSFKPMTAARAEDMTMFLRYLQDDAGAKVKQPRGPVDEQFG